MNTSDAIVIALLWFTCLFLAGLAMMGTYDYGSRNWDREKYRMWSYLTAAFGFTAVAAATAVQVLGALR